MQHYVLRAPETLEPWIHYICLDLLNISKLQFYCLYIGHSNNTYLTVPVHGNHWRNEGYSYLARFLILYLRAWRPSFRAFVRVAGLTMSAM